MPIPVPSPVDAALREAGSRAEGLTAAEAAYRLERSGDNAIPEQRTTVLALLARQLQDVLVYILAIALALSIAAPLVDHGRLTGENLLEPAVIAAILVLNVALGFVQEFQAERAIAELRRLASPHVRVRRGGHVVGIPAREVVRGDLMVLEPGDRISADGVVVRSAHLRVDESTLTGESLDVAKTVVDADEEAEPHAVFSGTLVTRGTAEVVVTATGLDTQIGHIARAVQQTADPETPLQQRLRQLARLLGVVAVVLVAVVMAVGAFRRMPLVEMFEVGVSLAVSVVPEGLPAVVTVCFALGVRRMVAHNAIVRRLDALETLGAVTVICADKTGTITENRMRVVDAWSPDGELDALARVAVSCNRAELPAVGDPTELALLRWGLDVGALREAIDDEEVPFSAEAQHMRTRHGDHVYVKGAPHIVGTLVRASDGLERAADAMASKGLRVLAAAVLDQRGGRLVGVYGLEDPPREGVVEAVAEARRAGIRSVMITGDRRATALAIAARVGIEGEAMDGGDLGDLDDEALAERISGVGVFARMAPMHKLRVLAALQSRGEVVCMSGDGVNDAPALKRAHVGVAMGRRGTEVAREASDIVLADDHFATIVRAVREGRRLHDNIRRFVLFLLRANFDELLVILAAVAASLPLPYLPIHILWINLLTDGVPALALATERAEPDVMDRPPRPPTQHLLEGEWLRLVVAALLGFGLTMGIFLWYQAAGTSIEHTRAVVLTFGIALELVLAYSARSQALLWSVGPFGNRWMNRAVAGVLAAHLLVLYTPLATAFRVVPLDAADWAVVIGASAIGAAVAEGLKLPGLARAARAASSPGAPPTPSG